MDSESLTPSDCHRPMRWWQRHLGNCIHFVFICIATMVLAFPVRTYAQKDGVIYEKVREQERHIDATDQTVKENRKDLQQAIEEVRKESAENHETLDEYKFAFVAVSGALTLLSLFGFRMSFIRGKESNG